MFLFTVEAKVNPKSKQANELRNVGGAFVSCYISFKNYEAAQKLARIVIQDEGWIPSKEMEAHWLNRSHLKTKKDKQYYSEALRYGYCLVFYTWPKSKKRSKK